MTDGKHSRETVVEAPAPAFAALALRGARLRGQGPLRGLCPLISVVMILGCAHGQMQVETLLPNGTPLIVELEHTSLARQDVYLQAFEIPEVGFVLFGGCDQKVSGNLSAVAMVAAAIFAPPVSAALAAVGIAGQELASQVDHREGSCPLFPTGPVGSAPETGSGEEGEPPPG